MASDAGVALTYLDPIVDWLPEWHPKSSGRRHDRVSRSRRRSVAGVRRRAGDRTAFSPSPASRRAPTLWMHSWIPSRPSPRRRTRPAFWSCWRRCRCGGLTHLSQVDELRRLTDRPNIRLLFDTWHYCRAGREGRRATRAAGRHYRPRSDCRRPRRHAARARPVRGLPPAPVCRPAKERCQSLSCSPFCARVGTSPPSDPRSSRPNSMGWSPTRSPPASCRASRRLWPGRGWSGPRGGWQHERGFRG